VARTAQQAAADWAARMGQASQRITDGVNAVTVAPGQLAAKQKQVWLQNTTSAADKFARNVAAVTLESWRADTVNKGISRIGTGAANAQPKFEAFMTKLLPYIESGRSQLKPRGDFAANVARMNAWVNHMHGFKA
jgi:hypothetical protein